MSYYKQADFIRLAIDQGFNVQPLMGGTGVRVYGKDGKSSHCVYTGSSQNRSSENTKAALKRLGVVFPAEHARKAKVLDFKKTTEVAKPMGLAESAKHAGPPPNPLQEVKQRMNDVMTALAGLEQAIAKVEDESKKLQVLRDAMRALGT